MRQERCQERNCGVCGILHIKASPRISSWDPRKGEMSPLRIQSDLELVQARCSLSAPGFWASAIALLINGDSGSLICSMHAYTHTYICMYTAAISIKACSMQSCWFSPDVKFELDSVPFYGFSFLWIGDACACFFGKSRKTKCKLWIITRLFQTFFFLCSGGVLFWVSCFLQGIHRSLFLRFLQVREVVLKKCRSLVL